MPWMKVDDNLHAHRKPRKAGVPAMGLWVLAGSWACDMLSDGFVPDYIAQSLDPDYEAHAAALVRSGLWEEAAQDDDEGWRFVGWDEYQPTKSEVEKKREDARERMARVRGKRQTGSDDVRANSDATSQNVRLTPSRPDPSPKNNDGYTPEFESFWALYPAKANKSGAFKAYKAAAKTHDDLEGKLRGYLNARAKVERSGEFVPQVPHATTWLNGNRWEDYATVTTTTDRDGQQIPEWSKDECDDILGGPDYWVPNTPPEGLDLFEEKAWKREQVAQHLNERRRKAWEAINSERSAA